MVLEIACGLKLSGSPSCRSSAACCLSVGDSCLCGWEPGDVGLLPCGSDGGEEEMVSGLLVKEGVGESGE